MTLARRPQALLLLGAVACGSNAASTPTQPTIDGGVSQDARDSFDVDALAIDAEPSADSSGSTKPTDAGSARDAGANEPDTAPILSDSGADAPAVVACASMAAVADLLTQFGTDETHSTITSMGSRFEAAFAALPISATNAAFLATASANPTVDEATSGSGMEWKATTIELYPSGAPSPEDVMQHDIGDCDGDSALASLAYVNPAFVRSLITDNGDGSFAVAMFDPGGRAITVAVDSTVLVEAGNPANLGEVSSNADTGDWATVLEKAVMKYDVAYGTVGQIDGIGSEYLLPMFTGDGDSIAISPGALTPTQFQTLVTTALAAGRYITGGFNQDGLPIGDDSTVTGHGYAVMVPTDPSSDMADMRNPWGVNPWSDASKPGYDVSTDGLLRIPLSTIATSWPQIIDLRIIDPGPHCAGVTKPFVPKVAADARALHLAERHRHVHAKPRR